MGAELSPQAFGPTARGLHGRLSVHQSALQWQLRAGGHCGQAWQHAARGALVTFIGDTVEQLLVGRVDGCAARSMRVCMPEVGAEQLNPWA